MTQVPGSPTRLRLITRADCELCEHMHAALATLGGRYPLPELELVDVDSDPQLRRRWGLKVPVLLLGDALVCAGEFKAAELLRLLRL